MGLKDKLANAKTTDWLTKDVSDLELKQIRDSIRNRTTLIGPKINSK